MSEVRLVKRRELDGFLQFCRDNALTVYGEVVWVSNKRYRIELREGRQHVGIPNGLAQIARRYVNAGRPGPRRVVHRRHHHEGDGSRAG